MNSDILPPPELCHLPLARVCFLECLPPDLELVDVNVAPIGTPFPHYNDIGDPETFIMKRSPSWRVNYRMLGKPLDHPCYHEVKFFMTRAFLFFKTHAPMGGRVIFTYQPHRDSNNNSSDIWTVLYCTDYSKLPPANIRHTHKCDYCGNYFTHVHADPTPSHEQPYNVCPHKECLNYYGNANPLVNAYQAIPIRGIDFLKFSHDTFFKPVNVSQPHPTTSHYQSMGPPFTMLE